MTGIEDLLEQHEAKERERRERETEIVQLDLQLFTYARKQRYTLGDEFYRKFALRNAMILDYGKTYGTEAQERLREKLDEAREKFTARAQDLEDAAGIKGTGEVEELRKQVRLYRGACRYYRDQLNEANDISDALCYAFGKFTDRHPEHAAELKELIDYWESHQENDE